MAERISEGILVLIRHGESQWNALQQWTGLTDIGLSEKGKQEAVSAASKLTDISFDCAFTSRLIRASDTLRIILETLKIPALPVTADQALNERDYGIYTGKNKLEIQKEIGDEAYLRLRRGWDCPIPEGESLKQVYERVIPYYDRVIAPLLTRGKHILVVAHGNSLRALMKKLENVSDADIPTVELATGEILIYHINASGDITVKEKR
jgi:2,3-bisphosphoglycerate-dependent phosphoglycerate mutase